MTETSPDEDQTPATSREAIEPPVMILCDWAEVLNGKLYVMGGGIEVIWSIPGAATMLSIGLLIRVGWNDTNRQMKLRVGLLNEDGAALPGPDGQPFAIMGEIEVGRPAGVRPGSTITVPLAMRIPPMLLPDGGYRFEMYLDERLTGAISFTVRPQKGSS